MAATGVGGVSRRSVQWQFEAPSVTIGQADAGGLRPVTSWHRLSCVWISLSGTVGCTVAT